LGGRKFASYIERALALVLSFRLHGFYAGGGGA
jgi:hypothetical protein